MCPSLPAGKEHIQLLDIRNRKALARARPSDIACVTEHRWIDGRTVRFWYTDIDGATKTVDITITSDKPTARLQTAPPAALTPKIALARVRQTDLAQALSREYPNAMMFVEASDAEGIHVYLGFDEGTHTTRHSALLVRPDQTVWKEITRPDYELQWVPADFPDPHHHVVDVHTQGVPISIPDVRLVRVPRPRGERLREVVTNRTASMRAYIVEKPWTTNSRRDHIQIEYLGSGEVFEIEGIPLEYRPFSDLAWVGDRYLVFDRWSQPHYGIHYVVDVVKKKLILASRFPDQFYLNSQKPKEQRKR